MKVPRVLASWCLKSRPLFYSIRSPSSTWCLFSVGTSCILVPQGSVPIQPKLCAQSALPLPSCTASLPTSCCSHSARGLFRRVACTVRYWKEWAFIRHCSSLHWKIHYKMPEHLLGTFVYAVDIFDLSYLIKCFLKRCFLLFQSTWPHSWKCSVMVTFEPKGESISVVELFKVSDLASNNTF